jgi:hypothetical protein
MNTNLALRSFLRRRSVAVLAALALGLATPAFGDHKHKHHGHGHGHGHVRHVYHAPYAPVHVRPLYVPTWIRPGYVETYRPYYRGPVYYAPHGHTHALYTFPVYHDHVLVRESRQYCRGEVFFANGPAYGPHFSLRIAF